MAQDGLMIDAREVAALATAIHARITEVRANALQANADAEVAHAAATVAATAIGKGDSDIAMCRSRFSELAAGIALSEAQKIEALEREAVTADDMLGRMQEPGADIGAMQPALLAAFGFMPLTPAEPSAIFTAMAEPGIAVLCVARRTNAGDVDADPTATWFASDSAHVNITLSGGQPPSCHAELCATLRALASRVRVSASLVPIGGAGALPLPLPLPVAAECSLNVAENGVRVTFRVPEARPKGAAVWLLRVTHLSVRDAPLRLGTLEAGARIFFRHHHSASCNHFSAPLTAGEVYNAAVDGDVQRLTSALANGGSTGEKNGVRDLVSLDLSRIALAYTLTLARLYWAGRHDPSDGCLVPRPCRCCC